MSNPRHSLPEPLRAQVEAAALQFAAEIVSAFEQSVRDVGDRLSSPTAVTPARVKAPAARVRQPAAPRGLERRIEAALRRSEELGVEQLNRVLGTTTPELKPVLEQMLGTGQIAKRGQARGTKYYLP